MKVTQGCELQSKEVIKKKKKTEKTEKTRMELAPGGFAQKLRQRESCSCLYHKTRAVSKHRETPVHSAVEDSDSAKEISRRK